MLTSASLALNGGDMATGHYGQEISRYADFEAYLVGHDVPCGVISPGSLKVSQCRVLYHLF